MVGSGALPAKDVLTSQLVSQVQRYLVQSLRKPFLSSCFVFQVESDLAPILAKDILHGLAHPALEPYEHQCDADRKGREREGVHVGTHDKERYVQFVKHFFTSGRVFFHEPYYALVPGQSPATAKAELLEQLKGFEKRVRPNPDPSFIDYKVTYSGKSKETNAKDDLAMCLLEGPFMAAVFLLDRPPAYGQRVIGHIQQHRQLTRRGIDVEEVRDRLGRTHLY